MSESSSLSECFNIPMTPHVSLGTIHVKIPVVLAEIKVQIDLEATIPFPDGEHVLEIKNIKKRLKLTQCRLLLPTNKLFLSGFVRKNIQYAKFESNTSVDIQSTLRSLTYDIPFRCVTPLTYLNRPMTPIENRNEEFEFFSPTSLPSGYPATDSLLSGDLTQYDQISKEYFNELPYCELISAKFTEIDEALDRTVIQNGPIGEGTFTKIQEKMVVDLTLKVLQKQQLIVHSSHPIKDEEELEAEFDD